ncbi:hypothetical protein HS088_TW21G00563 [Tripterygium wilfordii]|uniref:Stigma-specific Stig1 family protein n=1 Tax=Tripterygium wilfordii TaxID=458696 RepID=A0A7J7C3S2_TRIWF|nr:stigma-specific STIG1-like protein 1 [Tripterygium wilfordii]KAF5728416.1 hypothetical protein HS088_TW21G00563 [Tripterygium wilfordii]
MKFSNLFIVLVLFMALLLNLASPLPLQAHEEDDEGEGVEITLDDEEVSSSYEHGFGRFLGQRRLIRHRGRPMKCNKFPRICGGKGSPGPHCCKKRCVNVLRDSANCGRCGKKCKYNEVCCDGKCVNPSFNRRHCGGCNNMCSNGGFCAFGLCNYA